MEVERWFKFSYERMLQTELFLSLHNIRSIANTLNGFFKQQTLAERPNGGRFRIWGQTILKYDMNK
jgi:hypothetical protein